MRIGFASIYSWRPHVEHMHYLAGLVRQLGHEPEFLTCDGDLPACYTRELRDVRPDWLECLMCRAGGIRSYEANRVSTIGEYVDTNAILPINAKEWPHSSASTLGRFESEGDYKSAAFQTLANRLEPSTNMAYRAASAWIKDKRLDAVVVFNGRMDATRAIFEASRANRIPVATVERTWFGDGLQILPNESCLGLGSVDRLVSQWSEKPLTLTQASKAAGYIASRFLRRNQNEWRAYNVNADVKPWPVKGQHKVLLLPGSINEVWGHPDWGSGWSHPLDAYDAMIDHFSLKANNMVLRCHPNWGENIGKVDGQKAELYYTNWAKQRGVTVIPSTDRTSTLGLIEQADAIILASGSAALEAGALGKQVIAVAGANYQKAGIREEACTPQQLSALRLRSQATQKERDAISEQVRRQTLRFAYTITHRTPQYVDYVRCETPTRYAYKAGGDGHRLIGLLMSGELEADNSDHSINEDDENTVLTLMKDKQWEYLMQTKDPSDEYRTIKRRFPYTSIDTVRSWMVHGDR